MINKINFIFTIGLILSVVTIANSKNTTQPADQKEKSQIVLNLYSNTTKINNDPVSMVLEIINNSDNPIFMRTSPIGHYWKLAESETRQEMLSNMEKPSGIALVYDSSIEPEQVNKNTLIHIQENMCGNIIWGAETSILPGTSIYIKTQLDQAKISTNVTVSAECFTPYGLIKSNSIKMTRSLHP
jgi:hypothetical protein